MIKNNFKLYEVGLEAGRMGLKYNSFWSGGLMFRNKKDVLKALNLGFRVLSKDKITGKVTLFDYKTKQWEAVK